MLVEARSVGRKGTAVEPREIPDLVTGGATLADLIAHVVRVEVAAYDARDAARRVVRMLTESEIAAAAAAGKVDPGGRPRTGAPEPAAAVAAALEAFADGRLLVFVDERQVTALDDEIEAEPATRVRFVRLTALAGG